MPQSPNYSISMTEFPNYQFSYPITQFLNYSIRERQVSARSRKLAII
jgi:hypothetical protein